MSAFDEHVDAMRQAVMRDMIALRVLHHRLRWDHLWLYEQFQRSREFGKPRLVVTGLSEDGR